MRARDVIVIARRRAGITQRELARRLGVTRGTISRWESGTTEPKFCVVQKTTVACGFDLTLGFANADGGSWNSLIFEQLRLTPAERVRQLARGRFDRVDALKAFCVTGVRAIVVGETAGALHGWPLTLHPSRGIDLLVHDEDRARAEDIAAASSDPELIHLPHSLPGAWGYGDLSRNCVPIEVGGVVVQVAALVDLTRIALSERGGHGGLFGLAFDETLRLTERLRSEPVREPRKLSEQEAREAADEWLARQTPACSTTGR